MPDIFVSYSRSDADFACRLRDTLKRAGKHVWIDIDTIEPAAEWFQRIIDGIDRSDAFVVIMTPAALRSRICAAELAHAVRAGKRIVPIVHREPIDDAPDELSSHNYIWARTPDEFERAVADVIEAVDSDPAWTTLHTELLLRARAWRDGGRRRSGVLRGAELRVAQTELLCERPKTQPQPIDQQEEFVEASVAARRWRRRWAGGVGAFVASALIGLGVWGLTSSSEATHERAVAQSRQLAGLSRTVLTSDHELSLLLALQSRATEPTPESADALMAATTATPNLVRHLPRYGGEVHDVVFAADGALYTAGIGVDHNLDDIVDHDIRRWFPEDEDSTVFATAENAVSVLAADGGGHFLAAGGFDGTVTVFDLGDGSIMRTWQATSKLIGVAALTAHPSGRSVVTGDLAGNVVAWDLTTEPPAPDVIAEGGRVFDVRYRPDGAVLMVLHEREGGARSIDLHDLESGAVTTIPLPESGATPAAEWSPDGANFAVGADGDVAFFNASGDGDRVWVVEQAHAGKMVSDVAFTADGKRVLTSGGDAIRGWSIAGGGIARGEPWALHRDSVRAITVDGAGLCASVARDGGVIVWRENAKRMDSWVGVDAPPVELIDVAGGGAAVTAALRDEIITVFDHDNGTTLLSVESPSGAPFTALALSEPPRWLVAGDAAGAVHAWDLAASEPAPQKLFDLEYDVVAIGLHASSPLVAAGDAGGRVAIWDGSIDGVFEPRLYVAGSIERIVFGPDGVRLAITGSSTVRLVTIGDRLEERDIDPGHVLVAAVAAFSPDSEVLVTGGADGEVLLSRLTDDEPSRIDDGSAGTEPLLHDRWVDDIAFSPDGLQFAVADASGTITIRQSRTLQAFGVPLHMDNLGLAPTAITFDGARLIAAVSGEVQSWNLDPAALEEAACDLAGRDFTDPERQVFGPVAAPLCPRTGSS